MNFIEKLKKDKKFRRIVGIIVLFIIFLNYRGQQQSTVTEEYCNQFEDDKSACIDVGCAADVYQIPFSFIPPLDPFECLATIYGWVKDCTAKPTESFMASSIYSANYLCGEDYMAVESEKYCAQQLYKCVVPPPGDECKESWQKSLSKMIPFNFARGWGCEGRAYAAIGIIVFAVLMVM